MHQLAAMLTAVALASCTGSQSTTPSGNPSAEPSAGNHSDLTLHIYNRTQSSVVVSGLVIVPCRDRVITLADTRGGDSSVPADAVDIPVSISPPHGYHGTVAVVVTAGGPPVVSLGEPAASPPPCQGRASPGTEIQP
jgi:hypothetical protein